MGRIVMEVGDKLKLDVVRIRGDGKGVAFTEDGTMTLIDGVTEGDKFIEVKITRVLEETCLAQKVSRLKADEQQRPDLVDSPYEMDDEEDDEEYEED
jgi:predicted RNA-binding protein with TRAM domain